MDHYEKVINEATERGSDQVPGVSVAAVDKDGKYLYRSTFGYNGILPDSCPLQEDQTFLLASSTKLVTSIAALQAVERGLISLDDPVDKYLPELTTQPIISRKADGGFGMRKGKNPVTLRHLLSHSSGAAYDAMDPTLVAWRESRGEAPAFSQSGIIEKDYAFPRVFEAGEGWMYGPGIDWAGLLVARLNNTNLEAYTQEHIVKPLGLTTLTYHPDRHHRVLEKLMRSATRNDDGSFTDGPARFFPEPIAEAGGHGLYASVHDYTRILSDLLKEDSVLLKKETVDLLFTPQLHTAASEALAANHELSYRQIVGGTVEGYKFNHGLGGLLVLDDIDREDFHKPKGTLTWSGMPNLLWSINREKGVALFSATAVVPYGDEKVWKLNNRFETAVWRNLAN